MKVLLLVANRSAVTGLIPSFKEAFLQLHLDGDVFIVNQDRVYQNQRKELKQYIVKHEINSLLCINDFCKDGKYLINQEIVKLVPCYIWFVDSMQSMKSPDPNLSQYKKISSFEPTDVKLSSIYHRKIDYVPLTMGHNLFCTSPGNTEKKYDVSFVGLVSGSEKRLKILNAIAKYCKTNHKKMVCYGHFWHNSHYLQKIIGSIKFYCKYPTLHSYVINQRISPAECADLYKQTKINLNIHIPQHTGFNCRTFEILGNNNFELCDEQDNHFINFIDRKHLVFYHNEKEVVSLFDYYLKHPVEREAIAQQGGIFVNEKYKFSDSVKKVLELR